ncbi:MAG: nucleotidyltransferase domain-containing protein [Halapricum sp.]
MIDQSEPGVLVSIPLGEKRVFRNQAMDDVLELLFRNPHTEFGVRQLREVTGHGAQTVDTALEIFIHLDLIRTRRESNKKLISINQQRIQKPDDPILTIPQPQFRPPVRAFLEEVGEDQGSNLVGVLLFGSVARGEADRASDIDVQVIVDSEPVNARRQLQDIRQQIEDQRFDGERYEIQLFVESVDSAKNYGDKLREIFSEGITLYESDELDTVREAVFDG